MRALVSAAVVLFAGSALAQDYTISNPWSGTAGDKANFSAFAFEANAGLFPNSVNPAGSLTTTFQLGTLALTRPNDTVTPVFGATGTQLTDANATVYIDIYTGYASSAFSGYVGSSTTGVKWSDTVANQPYTFNFAGLSLDSSTKYWFVFSEDNVAGDVAQFRALVNTSGDNLTAGAGKGYLVNDTLQVLTPAYVGQDWGVASVVTVPEPSAFALAGLGLGLLLFRFYTRSR